MIKAKGKILSGAFIAIVFMLVGIGALIPLIRSQFSTQATTVGAVENNERVVIAIEGMQCSSCAVGIKAMLKRTPGVVSAEVSLEKKEAMVEFNPSETSREKIVEAINNLGYRASVKE